MIHYLQEVDHGKALLVGSSGADRGLCRGGAFGPRGWARRQRLMRQAPHRLVFVDETSVRTGLTRLRGRAAKGQRLAASAPFGRWHTQTFIAGLTCEGLIAPGSSPARWTERLSTSGSRPNSPPSSRQAPRSSYKLSVHRSPRAAATLKARGSWLPPLPAYSPDLNPIEMAFSKLRAHLRRIGAKTFDAVITALGNVCNLFTPDECLNYLAHAGHVADQTQTALTIQTCNRWRSEGRGLAEQAPALVGT